MSDLTIPKDRIGRIDDLLLRCIDPTFHRVSRYNHGYASGVIDALDLLYDEKHPKLNVNEYTEELTADSNLGHEALKLIDEFLQAGDFNASVEHAVTTSRRMHQLIEAWKANTWTKAHIPEVKVVEPVHLQLPDGRSELVRSQADLMTIGDVEKATEDYGHLFFRRLGLMEQSGRSWLYAEFVSTTGAEQSHTRIGELVGDIKRLNLPHLCTE